MLIFAESKRKSEDELVKDVASKTQGEAEAPGISTKLTARFKQMVA